MKPAQVSIRIKRLVLDPRVEGGASLAQDPALLAALVSERIRAGSESVAGRARLHDIVANAISQRVAGSLGESAPTRPGPIEGAQ